MSLDEIKQKYARRYEMYLKLVRELRHTVAEDEDSEDLITLDKEDLVEMRKWLIALNSLDTYIQNHREGNGERTLRGKQVNVFEDLRNFLEAGGKNGYVKLPTGFGKTVLFIEFIEALNLRSLIVVPTKLLISQTEVKLKKFAPDLEAGKVYQKAKEFGRQVTIITYDSLMSKLKDGSLNPNDYDCVILDEVHQALGEQSRKAIEQFTGGIKIGFTATPDFSAEKGVKDLLGIEIHRMSIREGVESGHLCSFANRLVRTEADISNVKTRGKELDEAQLAEAVDIASRNEMAIRIYKERFDGELAVAYCVGVRHAKKLAELFCQVGVAATVIHGKMNDKERESIIEQYDNGEIKVLCNADLLVEGFDEPRASVCFNLRPVKSGVMAEQRGGRVMRLDETNPNKLAYIFDFVDKGTDES
ncbi:MAG: DEAD/DEAH box helicase, partial [Patescibacteria group bacterium]